MSTDGAKTNVGLTLHKVMDVACIGTWHIIYVCVSFRNKIIDHRSTYNTRESFFCVIG